MLIPIFFVMAALREQRAAVMFCFLHRKNAAATVLMLKTAYKVNALSGSTWFYCFKNCKMEIDDNPRPGGPLMSRIDKNVTKTCALLLQDQCQTIVELEMLSGISWSLVQRILTTDLSMTRVAAKFMPRILIDQKECWVETCRVLKAHLRIYPIFFQSYNW